MMTHGGEIDASLAAREAKADPRDGKRAAEILAAVQYPETIVLLDGTPVRTLDLALAVANDQHPGDDCIPPRWLRRCAVAGTDVRRLHKMVQAAGGTLTLGPAVLPEIVSYGGD